MDHGIAGKIYHLNVKRCDFEEVLGPSELAAGLLGCRVRVVSNQHILGEKVRNYEAILSPLCSKEGSLPLL